jgi:hypothetical protein
MKKKKGKHPKNLFKGMAGEEISKKAMEFQRSREK